MATSLSTLSSQFPLTFPVPNPRTHADILSTADLHREEDLLRNATSFRAWWSAIHSTSESLATLSKNDDKNIPLNPLLGPLATPLARTSLQRLTFLYESAIAQFPTSFKLWKSYLNMRMSFVMGKRIIKKKSGGKKKLPEMKDALEEEREDLEEWEGEGLDPVVGWEEWKSLVATFERALMWLPRLPRLWLTYFTLFIHPKCPSLLSHSHARRTFDRALRTLPPSLHSRIWVRYLLWSESQGGLTTAHVHRRYLAVDPSLTEHFTHLLLNPTPGTGAEPRPLEAAKLLLSLARKASKGEYTSPEGKSPFQLLGDFIDVVEKFSEEVGLDVDETVEDNEMIKRKREEKEKETQSTSSDNDKNNNNNDDDDDFPSCSTADPLTPHRLNIEHILHTSGLLLYPDQSGRLWTGIATYWINRGSFTRAQETFENGLKSVVTVRDFTQIFDAYVEFGEGVIGGLMGALEALDEEGDDDDDDGEDREEMETELDVRMKEFEELADRRPFLVNDVLIRRNPNDVQEWEKRVALWGEDDEKVAETYTRALETINPRRASANLHRLYINFARFYEDGGTVATTGNGATNEDQEPEDGKEKEEQKQEGKAEPDIPSARRILEKATKVNFRQVDDLAEVWCEWSEMEIRHGNYDEAIRVMQRATAIPKDTKVNYHDHTLPAQTRLFKSLKLWSFYVDLEESIGTTESTKQVYDKILELRIANAQIIVNYALFLEENKYFEESFKVYERGVELFTFPVSFELWNIYLSKFVKRYGGSKLERTRDLFEQALEKCPPKSCKPIFLMYSKFEEDYGLAKRSMGILERATKVVQDQDKFEMFTIYIAKATANYGLPATRPIYEHALEVLPDRQTALMSLRFASLERKLGEIDRARAIYAHASQFCDPRTNPQFWTEWNSFEIETGSEDTFREMLRIKRSVQAQFNTEASYLVAEALATRSNGAGEEKERGQGDAMDAVAAAAGAGPGVKGPAFVAAKSTKLPTVDGEVGSGEAAAAALAANVDEIHISDDEGDE